MERKFELTQESAKGMSQTEKEKCEELANPALALLLEALDEVIQEEGLDPEQVNIHCEFIDRD